MSKNKCADFLDAENNNRRRKRGRTVKVFIQFRVGSQVKRLVGVMNPVSLNPNLTIFKSNLE